MSSPVKRNHFAAALVSVLEKSGLKLRHLALQSGISPGDLSNLRAGKKIATLYNVQKLAEVLPAELGDLLYLAFFRDMLPPDRQRFFQLESTRNGGTKTQKEDKWERALRIIDALQSHPHMRRAILSLAETGAWLVEQEKS